MPRRPCVIALRTVCQSRSLSNAATLSPWNVSSPCPDFRETHDLRCFQRPGLPNRGFLKRAVRREAVQYQNGAVSTQEARGKVPGSVPSPELLEKLRQKGVNLPGMESMVVNVQHNAMTCPFCEGGQNDDKSFSIFFEDSDSALWNCFRGKCGQKGGISLAGMCALRK